jgi:hypothetical protein
MNAHDDLLLKVRGWIERAENDLSNARHTLTQLLTIFTESLTGYLLKLHEIFLCQEISGCAKW